MKIFNAKLDFLARCADGDADSGLLMLARLYGLDRSGGDKGLHEKDEFSFEQKD